MSPYEILGLNEDESDERTIKRAYAKLLKQHRPDQDPEGFRRVHAAYQNVMRWRSFVEPAVTAPSVSEDPADVSSLTTVSSSEATSSVPVMPIISQEETHEEQHEEPQTVTPTPVIATSPPVDQPIKVDRSHWQAAVAAVMQAAASSPSKADIAVKQTLTDLLRAVDAGHGSVSEWATLASEVIGQRWELLSGFLDSPAMECLLRDRRLEQLQGICKRVAARQGVATMPRWLAVWLDQQEDSGAIEIDDDQLALRVVAWSALLAPALASRLVALLERSAISSATIEKADRLLAAGAYRDLLSDALRRQLVAHVVGSKSIKDDGQNLHKLRRVLGSLDDQHPIRRLAATYAGVRVQTEEVGCLGALFGWVIILTCLGLAFVVIDLIRRVGELIGGNQVGAVLAVAAFILLIWQRKRVLDFLTQKLFAPFTLGVLWIIVWATFVGGPGVGISLPLPDDSQRVVSGSVTIGLLLGFALIRRWMLQLDRSPGGWRLLIPPFIEAAAHRSGAVHQSKRDKQIALLVGVTWSMVMVSSILLVEPLSSQPRRLIIALLWLSGPIALTTLAIRAWILVWLRSPMRSWTEIHFWCVASVLIWLATFFVSPWLSTHVMEVSPWLFPIVIPGVMLLLASTVAMAAWWALRGREH